MSLQSVTITGADDGVDPLALINLSREFPWIEWGILYSVNNFGKPRYPSIDWLLEMRNYADRADCPCRLSLHLCGYVARQLAKGDAEWLLPALSTLLPARVQINGVSGVSSRLLEFALKHQQYEFISQINKTSNLLSLQSSLYWKPARFSALWDCSGGRGIEANSFPCAPLGVRLGFAGGITPGNVLDVLKNIGPRSKPFWIDCESGVRTDDVFDLGKVRALLEACKPYVNTESAPIQKLTGEVA